jgi:Phage tail tube protein
MPSNIPISNTNVDTVIGFEAVPGVVATAGKRLAYETNSLVPNQTMEKNVELRGNRQAGARVPGMKNPGGTLLRHQTDLSLPLSWFALLGGITSGVQLGTAPVAVLTPVVAGLVTSGTHSYKIVVTRPNGTQAYTVSNTVTTIEASSGKVTLTKAGVLPTGWTWAIYRTATGNAAVGPWILIPSAATLAANVTAFVDNIADATLLGAYPAITNNDQKHIIKTGLVLPTFSVQRMFPYADDAAAYFVALGAKANKGSVKVKGAGFYDISLDMLYYDESGPNATAFDVAPVDWRGGEKLHDAMLTAAKVLVDGAAFGHFLDFTLTLVNNLDTSDHPVGAQGGLGSLAEGLAESQVGATLKVAQPSDVSIARDTTVLHTLSFQHDFMTPGHYALHEFFGISFDPTLPAPSGQGILKYSVNGFGSQPDAGEQAQITIVNDQPLSIYNT